MPKPYSSSSSKTGSGSYSGAREIMRGHMNGSAGSTRASHGDVTKKDTGLWGSRFKKPSGKGK